MCIDSQMLSEYLDNELSEPYKTQVEEHLSHCAACRKLLETMSETDSDIKSLSVDESIIDKNKDGLYSLLDKKLFEGGKKVGFFRRKIAVSVPALATSAAAVVFIFIGGYMLFGTSPSQTGDILPSFSVQADSSNVRFVSSEAEGSLDDYTLEEILQYLDSKGYQVDISIKGIQPLE